MAVLDRHHAPRREAAPIANAGDLVDDRHLGIAAKEKIGVQRMRRSLCDFLNRAACRHQRLADDLSAIDALPGRLRRAAAKKVYLERLQIEDGKKVIDG